MSAIPAGRFAGEGRAMLAGLVLGGLVVAGLLVRFPLTVKHVDNALALDTSCSLASGECRRELPDGTEVKMRLDPVRPVASQAFQVEVRVYGGEAERVEFGVRDAVGALDQAKFERVGPGRWQAQAKLSWCGRAQMAATAVVESQGKQWQVPFAFEMERAR